MNMGSRSRHAKRFCVIIVGAIFLQKLSNVAQVSREGFARAAAATSFLGDVRHAFTRRSGGKRAAAHNRSRLSISQRVFLLALHASLL